MKLRLNRMGPWTLLRRLSLPYVARHRLRTLVTIFGVALGVAAMTALKLAYEPISHSYRLAVKRLAGRSSIAISNGEVGVPEDLLDLARTVPGVEVASASVRGFVRVAGRPGERLYVLGVDMLDDQRVRDYGAESAPPASSANQASAEGEPGAGQPARKPLEIEDPLVFLAKADSVALAPEFLRDNGLKVGDTLEVQGTSGKSTLRVRGTLDSTRGPGSLYGGRLALMDIFAAEKLFRLDHRFTQIDIVVKPRANMARVMDGLRAMARGRGVVEGQEASFEAVKSLLEIEQSNTMFEALGAVMVGLYLIFNTMLIAVGQRRHELGVLRALGMRRADVVRLVMVEALVLGALGCALGVPLGVGLARVLSMPFVFRMAETRIPVGAMSLTLRPGAMLAAIGVGMAGAMIASLIPAYEAVKIHPLEALRPFAHSSGPGAELDHPARYRWAATVGAMIMAATFAVWLHARGLVGEYRAALTAMAGFLLGISLMIPLLARAMARAVELITRRVGNVLTTMANRGLVSHMGRMAITTTVFVMCFSFVTEVGAAYSTLRRTFDRWFDSLFADADLVISAGAAALHPNLASLPGELMTEIAKLKGVRQVSAVRIAKVNYGGHLADLMAIDTRPQALDLVSGDAPAVAAAMKAARGVAVDERLAYNFGLHVGDTLELASPRGAARLPVIALVHHSENFRDIGAMIIDRQVYRAIWGDNTVDLIEPKLDPGADPATVMAAIRSRWGDEYGLFITTVGRFKAQTRAQVERNLAEVPPILAIALAIAVMAVVSSLLAAVLDRVRELGMMRAVGATRRQLTALIVLEAAFIGLIGGLLAAGVGAAFGYYQFAILSKSLNGVTLRYHQPLRVIGLASLGALLLPALAAYLPARQAARLEIGAALASE
jgi:putative ABC transport system permease protein